MIIFFQCSYKSIRYKYKNIARHWQQRVITIESWAIKKIQCKPKSGVKGEHEVPNLYVWKKLCPGYLAKINKKRGSWQKKNS